MPTSTSGGPSINTGNAAWDQGLGSIFGGLFPDPSRVAQAGYYGAEQRYKQLQSSQVRNQMAHQQGLDQAATTLTQPVTSYAPSPEGPNMPPIMQPPGSYVPAQAPPAAAPPSLGTTVAAGAGGGGPAPAPAPAAPPAAPAPIVAGQVGANMAPGGLSSLFAQGGGAVAPAGGGTMRLDQGTPPPTSSPAPGAGAPPASNATASDGSVPNNDTTSGIFHPGSITPPGGGRKTSGPANADGSPAKPMITAAQYVALAVGAGHEANQALLEWRSMISSAYDTGRIDENTYHHMMGAAEPSIINQDTASRTQITTTGMTNATELKKQGMVTGENARQFNEAIVQTVNPADPNGPPIPVRRMDLKPGMQEWNQGIATQRGGPVVVNGPNGPVNTTLSAAVTPGPNQPTSYQSGTADIKETHGGAYGTFVDPQDPDPTHARTMRTDDAAAKGWIPYGTMAPKTPMTANESFQQNAQQHGIDQEIYPQPQKGSLTSPGYVTAPVVFSPAAQAKIQALQTRFMTAARGDPGAAHRMAVQALQQSGDLPSATQVDALRNAGGVVSTAGGRVTDPRLSVSPSYDGKGTTTPHLWVGLKGEGNPNDPGAPTAFNLEPGPRVGSQTAPGPQAPSQGAPVANQPAPGPAYRSTSEIFGSGGGPPAPGTPPGPAPVPFFQRFLGQPAASGPTPLTTQQMYGGVSPTPAAPAAAAPPGAIGRAAPGAADGSIQYDTAGRPAGIVRGGLVYPMPAMAAGGGG